jgi:hypothetical protein
VSKWVFLGSLVAFVTNRALESGTDIVRLVTLTGLSIRYMFSIAIYLSARFYSAVS